MLTLSVRSASKGLTTDTMRVAFAHLDLGIGGAEQLVVSAALGLQAKGHEVCAASASAPTPPPTPTPTASWMDHHHPLVLPPPSLPRKVTLYTTQWSESHCFAPTRGDGALASRIRVYGDRLPRSILGRGPALCSSIRMCYLALVMLFVAAADAVFADGVSTMLPILRLRFPVLFYCHYPDKLLCTQRDSLLKRLYRAPLDWAEQWTTGYATTTVVNSKFTRSIFQEAFPALSKRSLPEILYPVADLKSFTPPDWVAREAGGLGPFVSLNRFERKKNVGLAIEALAVVKRAMAPAQMVDVRLIIAGGYDTKVTENVQYLQELEALAKTQGVQDLVEFKPSVSDAERDRLLQGAVCVIYTPENEHFGIVPIEAMYAGAPVLAAKSGGPLETVADGRSGFLRENTPDAFGKVMVGLATAPERSVAMGKAAHEHVLKNFGTEAFEESLDAAVRVTLTRGGGAAGGGAWLLAAPFLFLMLACFLGSG